MPRQSQAPVVKRAPKRTPVAEPAENGDAAIFYLNVRITHDLRQRMETYCQQYGVGRRFLVTKAIEAFLDERDQNPPQ